MIRRLFTIVACTALLATPLAAGLMVVPSEDGAAPPVTDPPAQPTPEDGTADRVDLDQQRQAELTPYRDAYVGLGERFLPDATTAPPDCAPDRDTRTHALLIGADRFDHFNVPALAGPENDVEILTNALTGRGVVPGNIAGVMGRAATRPRVEAAAAKVLAAAGCGDSVFLHVSGYTLPAADFGVSEDGAVDMTGGLGKLRGTFGNWQPADTILADGPYVLLNSPERGHIGVLGAGDLSRFALLLRNKGADVTLSLDVPSATAFGIEARQAVRDPSQYPRMRLEGGAPCYESACHTAAADPLLLDPRAGSFSAIYGTVSGDPGSERELPEGDPDAEIYGYLSYQLAVAIASEGRTTIGAIARRIDAQAETGGRWQSYELVSTDPDRDLIAEERPEETLPRQGEIVIETPQITRAGTAMPRSEVEIKGHILSRGEPIQVTVNRQPVEIGADGSFTGTLRLKPGLNDVEVFALTRANETITRSFSLRFEGDVRAVIGAGQRYALVLSAQTYASDSGIPSLETPIGDAEAVAEVLRERYGFVTELPMPGGDPLPLVLHDVTYRQLQIALGRLAERVGESDTVLIFYAGHGKYAETTGTAYWLTTDAAEGLATTYFDVKILTDALNGMRAKNVLVISDSCYSGMLSREVLEQPPMPEGERLLALQRLADRRSRVVISSGGNEPVQDGGGGGHSVFARALLDALEGPEEAVFSARELQQRIYSEVILKAPQEPDFRPIRGAGHDGGDFVFLRDE